MALAVCLLFDPEGDRLVRRLWERLESRGIDTPLTHTHGRHVPHLSLAVAREWDLGRVAEAVGALPPAEPCRLWIQGTVSFSRGRAALAVAVGADLARRQEAAALAVVGSGADLHHHYLPGRWVPHVSLATGGSAEHLGVIGTTVNDALPLTLGATRAALINSGTGEALPLPALL